MFRGMLQKGERVQIPKIIRWQFKLEPDQVLRVGFSVSDMFRGWQFFYAKMEKSGNIFIPKTTLSPWSEVENGLTGSIVEVTLDPV
jgi:hypothetical protein